MFVAKDSQPPHPWTHIAGFTQAKSRISVACVVNDLPPHLTSIITEWLTAKTSHTNVTCVVNHFQHLEIWKPMPTSTMVTGPSNVPFVIVDSRSKPIWKIISSCIPVCLIIIWSPFHTKQSLIDCSCVCLSHTVARPVASLQPVAPKTC